MLFFRRFIFFIIATAVLAGVAESGAHPCFIAMAAVTRRPPLDIAKYEGRTIASVEVVTEGARRYPTLESELLSLLHVAPNTRFSLVLVRESLQALFDSQRVANARVEVIPVGGAADAVGTPIRLRFIIRPEVRVGQVLINLPTNGNAVISEDEIRARLTMLEPGDRVTEQALRANADAIQVYLRDHGFYRADVSYSQQPAASGLRSTITFRIAPGPQSRVAAFNINIVGFDPKRIHTPLKIAPGAAFTRAALGADVNTIRQAIIAQGYLAPKIEDPQVKLDTASDTVTVDLKGAIGPKVSVTVEGEKLSDKRARQFLPVKTEGSIDESAIVEGARRLRNDLQQNGYFFADVTETCFVTPPLATPATPSPVPVDANAADTSCQNLNSDELSGRAVQIKYNVERGRRYKLTDIRIEGTNKLSYADVAGQLRTQKANALGFVPVLGYGRGYTSRDLLTEDQRTIQARMQDLGYRKAQVSVRQGVSLGGDNLIITFVVNEGPLTRVAGVEIRGNELYTEKRLYDEPCTQARGTDQGCTITGGPYSRTVARSDGERIREFYEQNGYIDTNYNLDVVDLPPRNGDEQVRLIYSLKEGNKVFINRIFVNGNVRTKKEAILKVVPLKEGEILRADQITESERLLYQTDAFRQVIIRTRPAGETASGFQQQDIIIYVEEQKPRTMDYGGGYSTDNGPLGLYDIRNANLFGKLRQGTLRTRASQRQELVQLQYFDPRFLSYGKRQFAPLNLSVQYQRDTNVTRFFRSTIDAGNFGIVQRTDAKGNPIDQFGNQTGQPSINRFTFTAETQRDFQLKLGERGEVLKRSTLFLRYSYEDVRLFNIGSLLIAPILRPDRAIRLSSFGASFARDTRDSQLDATRGEFLTADYMLALKQLGGSLSFNKFQSTYRRYYKLQKDKKTGIGATVLAGGVQLGLASLTNPLDRNGISLGSDFEGMLPISERFFSGGSTTLRGFGFEEAGPRVAICPGGDVRVNNTCPPSGTFFDSNGKPVTLNPFLVPIGGNAFIVANAEARISVTKLFGIVPFYDGGNVYRRVSDLFGHGTKPLDPNLRAQFTHTVGLGLRIKTPFGPLAIDYGYLLNPPTFILPQEVGGPAIIRLPQGHIQIRFGQAF